MAGPPGAFAAAAPPAVSALGTPDAAAPSPLQSPTPTPGWAGPVRPGQRQATLWPEHGAAASRKRSCNELRAGGRNRWRTIRCDQTRPEVVCVGPHRCEARGDALKYYFSSWPCFYHDPPPTNRGTPLYRLRLFINNTFP